MRRGEWGVRSGEWGVKNEAETSNGVQRRPEQDAVANGYAISIA